MLTVASFNLYLGADLATLFGATSADDLAERARGVREQMQATRFEERAEAIARLLVRERVDVAGLQEVSRWTADGTVVADFLPTLRQALAAAGSPYDAYAVTPSFAGGLPVAGEWMRVDGSNVTLVREGSGVDVLEERTGVFDRTHEVVTGIDGVRFPVERGWSLLQCLVGDGDLWVANTHFEAYSAEVRDAQRDELVSRVEPLDGATVLAGDFNARPEEIAMPGTFADAWTAAGSGDGDTWGQAADLDNEHSTLSQRIDYVFVRGAARVARCRVVGGAPDDRTRPHGLWPSDHAAVVAEIDLTR